MNSISFKYHLHERTLRDGRKEFAWIDEDGGMLSPIFLDIQAATNWDRFRDREAQAWKPVDPLDYPAISNKP